MTYSYLQKRMENKSFIEGSGEKCGMCWSQEHKLTPATHKVEETSLVDSSAPKLSQYICDRHFRSIFGTPKQSK